MVCSALERMHTANSRTSSGMLAYRHRLRYSRKITSSKIVARA